MLGFAWIVPLVLTAGVVVRLVLETLLAADEARRLGRATRELGALRPALVEVRSGVTALRASSRRRPSP